MVKMVNPFQPSKRLLFVAGLRRRGTNAALLSFPKNFDELCKPNDYDATFIAHVVEGIDADNDGRVDMVEFCE